MIQWILALLGVSSLPTSVLVALTLTATLILITTVLGIFYGAAHLSEMESEMEKKGYHRTGERWMNAWDIKPRADETRPPSPAQE